ncbi:TIGR03016 family PEP-CTERM system-associated outer membrane protein [Alteromonas sp.]|nr:TIGR03016 family PEP-CTERM system-associated outer membrane protein [Alteromonas sp.]
MDITMPSAINNKLAFQHSNIATFVAAALLAGVSSPAVAKLDISATASTQGIFQDVQSEENGNFSLSTISINPNVNVAYQSRTFKGLWQGTLTHLSRDRNDNSREDNYGEYSYSAQWAPVDELITFQASGALNYQNAQAGNFLVSDFFTNSDALAKTRSNRFGTTVTLSQGDWVRGQGTASYSDVASERNALNNGFALDNDTYQLSGTLTNGDEAKYLIWNLTGTYQNTERAQASTGNFVSRTGSGFIDVHIADNWALRATASHEANQIAGRNDTTSITREFNTVGAGITFRKSTNRYISLTINQNDSDIENNDDGNFLGLDAQWALSSRTQISATYGRRFFGDTASANVSYNSKYFRIAFGYSEDVTNTSRLLANPENLGVFVCPVSSSSIASCFQPNSLAYVPEANEQFVQISTQNVEFNDDIIVRKSSNFQMGYDFSRVTLGMSWRYSLDDALDQDRLTRTYSLGSTLAYKIGSYTNLNASVNYANIEQRTEQQVTTTESDNWNLKTGINREFGTSLSVNADLTYIKRSGDLNTVNTSGGQFGANFTDRRITLSLSYTYE